MVGFDRGLLWPYARRTGGSWGGMRYPCDIVNFKCHVARRGKRSCQVTLYESLFYFWLTHLCFHRRDKTRALTESSKQRCSSSDPPIEWWLRNHCIHCERDPETWDITALWWAPRTHCPIPCLSRIHGVFSLPKVQDICDYIVWSVRLNGTWSRQTPQHRWSWSVLAIFGIRQVSAH